METQIWFCETCCIKGSVQYSPDSSDVSSIARLIRARHHQSSPGCVSDPRVLNADHPGAKECEELISSFQRVAA